MSVRGGYRLLEGVKVLECALLLNGDTVGMFFADLGAEVTKIEDPVRGDYIRDILGQIKPRVSPAHLQVNKNKRSVALDVRDPRGRAAFLELVKQADVFIDGMRAGAADKMGIGYAALKAVKTDIIYVQCTGYGAHGPYANIPTHGYQMTALPGGLPARIGPDGRPQRARGVQYMGGVEESSAASYLAAEAATTAALAALVRRGRTGEGAYIDVGASDAVLAAAWQGIVYTLNYDRITEFKSLSRKQASYEAKWPEGSARYQLYETKDGKFMLFGAVERKFWEAFCTLAGREDLAGTFSPDLHIDFGESTPGLRDEVQAIFRTRTLDEWMADAAPLGTPMGPAHAIEDVPSDPHIQARGILLEREDAGIGPFTYVTFPARIDGLDYAPPRIAPRHGSDTIEVLGNAGIEAAVIDDLLASRIAKQDPGA
ncbi:MAG: CaiB/BaiF CoA-transferase family protein [Novosphingobium sp.]